MCIRDSCVIEYEFVALGTDSEMCRADSVIRPVTVSYTHLDVYKRQAGDSVINQIVPRLLKLSNKFSLSVLR